MTLRQLEKLSKNPYYVLSEEQIAMLNKYRVSTFKDYKAKNYLENADDSTLEHVMLLDDATRAQSLSKDSVLYRGVVDSESWNSSKKFEGIKVGGLS